MGWGPLGGIAGKVSNTVRTVLPGIDPKKKPLAPAPTDAAVPGSLAAPAPPQGFQGMALAVLAAKRARRKGATPAGASGVGLGAKPIGSVATGAGSAPKSLLGY